MSSLPDGSVFIAGAGFEELPDGRFAPALWIPNIYRRAVKVRIGDTIYTDFKQAMRAAQVTLDEAREAAMGVLAREGWEVIPPKGAGSMEPPE